MRSRFSSWEGPQLHLAVTDTLVILTPGLPQRGRTRLSTLLECMLSMFLGLLHLFTQGGSKRVFILGPSHHVYLDRCDLSQCKTYQTPIGDLPLDLQSAFCRSRIDKVTHFLSAIAELQESGKFGVMSLQTDEDEHSIELHLPYVRKVFEGCVFTAVVILII